MSYETEMVGEKPSKKAPHVNYEKEMKGQKEGKKGQGFAAGGVAKMRRGVADKSGAPRHMAKKDMSKKGC